MFGRLMRPMEKSNTSADQPVSGSRLIAPLGFTDFKVIAPFIVKATQHQQEETILFSRGAPGSEEAEIGEVEMSIWALAQSPTARSWKAFAANNEKNIIGVSSISYRDAEVSEYKPADPATYKHKSSTVRMDFREHMQAHYDRLRKKNVGGMKHVCWDRLNALPSDEAKIIERDLIRWGFLHFNLARETIFTFTEVQEPFISLGWKLVDTLDVDLESWADKSLSHVKSFQIFILVRKPGELPDPAQEEIAEK